MADSSGILTGSGLRAYIEDHRKDAMARYDELHEVAAILRKGIETMPGSRYLGGLDQKALARRIVKPMLYAADLNEAQAKSLSALWAIYSATLGAPQSADKASRTAFDPAK